jgi:hypothetical protein
MRNQTIAISSIFLSSVLFGSFIGAQESSPVREIPQVEPIYVPDYQEESTDGTLEDIPTIPIIPVEPIPYPDNSTRLPPEPPIIEIMEADRDE